MNTKTRNFAIIFTAAVFFSACQPGSLPASQTPTEITAPDPLADAWLGEWTVWVQEEVEEIPEELAITAKSATLEGEIYLNDGDRVTFFADLNIDGSAAVGEWQSEAGKSGLLSLLISSDGKQFLGSLHGFGPMCAVREGDSMPDPCESEFAYDWAGGWQVWLGPLETEGLFFHVPGGESIGPLVYKIITTETGDNRTLSGKWEAVGSSGEIEAKLLENGIQFTGNMDGQFPFCGARLGSEKPDPCYGP